MDELSARGTTVVPRLVAILVAVSVILLPRPASAESVYEFVSQCRQDRLADCFYRIAQRIKQLNASGTRRICLPDSFGGGMFDSGVLPVSLLEEVRVHLSAARFGRAEVNVDDVMSGIVNGIYPCNE
jgi:hypothetical protein